MLIRAIDSTYMRLDDERLMVERSLNLHALELEQQNVERQTVVALMQSTLEALPDAALVVDLDGTIQSFNRQFVEMWTIPGETMEGRDEGQVFAHIIGQLLEPERFIATGNELASDPEADSVDEVKVRDGRVVLRYSMPQRLDGRPVGRVWSFRDITEARQTESKLVHDAIHDALTNLPNRVLFMDRLAQAIQRTKRNPASNFAVLFIDIDNFKTVNDSLGHLAGDELLVAVAARLTECVRPSDTVARLGGDEFALLLDDVASSSDAGIAAERLQTVIAAPISLRGSECRTGASIGIAMSAPHYARADEPLRDADTAMYRAKANGGAQHVLFQAGMHAVAVARMQMKTELHHALKADEFVLHFQPIVRLADSRLIGVEALLRWNHPVRGLIFPDEFMPVVDESELTVPVGRWVLEQACMRLARWQLRLGAPELTISINISPRHFSDTGFVTHVDDAMRAAGLARGSLALEITETMLMDSSVAAGNLAALREGGARISIDDFGTGYSSLSDLHRFSVDTLKVDRSFIKHIDVGRNLEIVRTILNLATGLELLVIAEGVENESQHAQLIALGCFAAQGYHFSPPADDVAIEYMIGARVWRPAAADRPGSFRP